MSHETGKTVMVLDVPGNEAEVAALVLRHQSCTQPAYVSELEQRAKEGVSAIAHLLEAIKECNEREDLKGDLQMHLRSKITAAEDARYGLVEILELPNVAVQASRHQVGNNEPTAYLVTFSDPTVRPDLILPDAVPYYRRAYKDSTLTPLYVDSQSVAGKKEGGTYKGHRFDCKLLVEGGGMRCTCGHAIGKKP